MTREEAIEVLKHIVGNINYDAERKEIYFTDQWVQAYELAIAALREQETVTNRNGLTGWISVEEKLPEPRTPVLTYGRKGAVGIGFTQPTSKQDGKVYFYARYGDHLPTHWMPLPTPPEVEV